MVIRQFNHIRVDRESRGELERERLRGTETEGSRNAKTFDTKLNKIRYRRTPTCRIAEFSPMRFARRLTGPTYDTGMKEHALKSSKRTVPNAGTLFTASRSPPLPSSCSGPNALRVWIAVCGVQHHARSHPLPALDTL